MYLAVSKTAATAHKTRRLHSAARMKEEVGLGLRRKLALVREGKLTLATYRSFFTSAKSTNRVMSL